MVAAGVSPAVKPGILPGGAVASCPAEVISRKTLTRLRRLTNREPRAGRRGRRPLRQTGRLTLRWGSISRSHGRQCTVESCVSTAGIRVDEVNRTIDDLVGANRSPIDQVG